MGFSIDSGFGALETLAIIVLISAAAIVIFFFVVAARQARKDVLENSEADDPLP